MKKIVNIIFIMILLLVPIYVLADNSINVSLSSITVEEGESSSITITVNDIKGEVKVESENKDIATVEESKWEDKEIDNVKYKVGTVTVKGVKAGETSVKITADEVDNTDNNDGEKKNDKIESIIKVTVNEKEKEPEKSTNNKIKELVVENQKVEKIDDNNYILTVINNVDTVNIKVTPEDEKAKVRGDGEKNIEIGDNNFEIVVTSESDEENVINVKVTRKSKYTVDDLNVLLDEENINSVIIDMDSDTKISSDILNKIKDTKKTVYLNYYDGNDKLLYSIILDGNVLEGTDEFITNIMDSSAYSKDIKKLANTKKGVELSLLNVFPKGSKIKYYVGNTYKSGEIVDIYYYDRLNNKLELYKDEVMVASSFIELEPDNYNNYYITKILEEEEDSIVTTGVTSKKTDLSKIFMIILVAVVITLIIVAFVLYCKKNNIDLKKIFKRK